jgi:hypothetical protein
LSLRLAGHPRRRHRPGRSRRAGPGGPCRDRIGLSLMGRVAAGRNWFLIPVFLQDSAAGRSVMNLAAVAVSATAGRAARRTSVVVDCRGNSSTAAAIAAAAAVGVAMLAAETVAVGAPPKASEQSRTAALLMLPVAARVAGIAAIGRIADPFAPIHFAATAAARGGGSEVGAQRRQQAAMIVAARSTAPRTAVVAGVAAPNPVVLECWQARVATVGLTAERIPHHATGPAANASTCDEQRETRRQSNALGHHGGNPFHVSKASSIRGNGHAARS